MWLEPLTSIEAAADFVIAALCCLNLIGYACDAQTAARKAGASALALVCGGLAVEAILYLSLDPSLDELSLIRIAAVLFVRSVLLLSAVVVGALLWRNAHR